MGMKVDLQEMGWQISPFRHCKEFTVAERTREIRGKKMSYKMYVPSVNLVRISWMNISYSLQKTEESRTRRNM
jgi:hypothetical protein